MPLINLNFTLKMTQNTQRKTPIKPKVIVKKKIITPVRARAKIAPRPLNTAPKSPSPASAVNPKPSVGSNDIISKQPVMNAKVLDQKKISQTIKKIEGVIKPEILTDSNDLQILTSAPNNDNLSFSALQITEVVQDTYEILMKSYEKKEQKEEINSFVKQFQSQSKMIFAKEKITNEDFEILTQILKDFNNNLERFLAGNSITYNEADIFVRIQQLEDKIKKIDSNIDLNYKNTPPIVTTTEKTGAASTGTSAADTLIFTNKMNNIEKKINQLSDKMNCLEKKINEIASEVQIINNAGHIQATQIMNRVKVLENYYVHLQNIITNLNQIVTSNDIADLKKQMQNIILILKNSNAFSDRG